MTSLNRALASYVEYTCAMESLRKSVWTGLTSFTRTRRSRLSAGDLPDLRPARIRKVPSTIRDLLGPDDHLPAVLPLEHQHLVGDLEAVPVDFEGAKDRVQIHLQDGVSHLLALQGAGARDGLQQDLAARIARGRAMREIRTGELL